MQKAEEEEAGGDFKKFLQISFGSGAELETQIEIAKRLSKTSKLDYIKIDNLLEEIMKMLNKNDLQINFLA